MLLHPLFSRLLLATASALILALAGIQPALPTNDPPPACGYSPVTAQMLSYTSQADWAGWVAQLSGARPVILDGSSYTITTRYSYALFNGQANGRAYDFILSQAQMWYPKNQIDEHEFTFDGRTWKNLIITLPGAEKPEEIILLTAHLDSTSPEAHRLAPGAEDNASGSAALLEAARLWRSFRFQRTVRLIWFTGEEQGLIGSKAYARDHDLSDVQAVINLDMFGYDADNDRCFELHAGTSLASRPLVSCFEDAIQAYQPDLQMDRITTLNMSFSDHSVFWDEGIGAVLVLENHMYNGAENGCKGLKDTNPAYHTTGDTLSTLNLASGFAIAKVSLAAAAGLAGPVEACFDQSPALRVEQRSSTPKLSWTLPEGVEQVRLLRSQNGCGGPWESLAVTGIQTWTDLKTLPGHHYAYRLEAWENSEGGVCASLPADCVVISTSPALPTSSRQLE
ncbi:MAG: M28 family peptidase [Anaerolineaceae bacterium]|nr:M28 family peptidase [Anaerolineaceae bacterium]